MSSINLSWSFPLIPTLFEIRKRLRNESEREEADGGSSPIKALVKKIECSE